MDFFSLFKEYLFSQDPPLTSVTVKNYLSDLQKFFTWYSSRYKQSFSSIAFSDETVDNYKEYLSSVKSSNRHLSSLRRFGNFLVLKQLIESLPQGLVIDKEQTEDPFLIDSFRSLLRKNRTADATVTNYIIDMQQFYSWIGSVKGIKTAKDFFPDYLSTELVEEYKSRMLAEGVAHATIERKLSSFRKYIWFLEQTLKEKINPIIINSLPYNNHASENSVTKQSVEDIANSQSEAFKYSNFPPLRFFQKIATGLVFMIDWLFVLPLTNCLLALQYILWLLSGQKLFVLNEKVKPYPTVYMEAKRAQNKKSRSFSSAYYAPLNSSKDTDRHSLIYKWNKKYQRLLGNPVFSLTHYGILFLLISLLGTYIYLSVFHPNHLETGVLGASNSQRLLSFSAKLLDQKQQPITGSTPVRFSLYTDPTASSSALLWQEIRTVNPNKDGSFSITLGNESPIPSTLFTDNPNIYLGTTIATRNELRPRSAIPTVGLSSDSETLQGMKVLTSDSDNPRNTILALDSTGNLKIGGSSSHSFEATNGTFTLSGQQVLLTTNLQTNGNLVLSPDGIGQIDLQKALINSLGSVHVDDSFAILATTSALPAMQIDQDFTGPLISASSSGVNKFLVDYVGSGTFANDLAVNGNNLTTTSPTFNLLATTVREIQFGTSATNISIGNTNGVTTINNATTALSGNLTIGGSVGVTLTANDAGIQFGGNGDHLLIASQGALLIGSNLNIEKGVSIVRSTTDGTSDLGSSDKPFDTLYVKNLNSSNLSTANNLGVGTTHPNFKLDVEDTQVATAAAFISNLSSTGTSPVGLALQLGYTDTTIPQNNNHFVDFLDGNGNIRGSIEANGAGVAYTNNGISDFGEYIAKDPSINIPYGAIVCSDTNGKAIVCDNTSQSIMGVASNTSGFLGGVNQGNGSITIGLTGQVAVNVSTRNGAIQAGDPIAASDIPGVGVKAISAGPIIGHALGTYSNNDPYEIGTVMALVQPSWFDPSIRLTDSGNLSIAMLDNSQAQKPSGQTSFSLVDAYNNVLTSSAAYSHALIANLQAGMIETKALFVSGNAHIGKLFADSIVVGGTNLEDYITQIVQQLQTTTATHQLATISELKTNIISPLASNSAVLVNGDLQTTGDASIGGTLSAQDIQAQDASISGTLHVKKLIADEIDGGQASQSATYITNIYNATPASPSGSLGGPSAAPSPIIAAAPIEDAASSSALIAANISLQGLAQQPIQTQPNYINVPAINMQFANVTQSFMNTGSTSLADTAIAGKLSIDSQLVLSDNSINVLGTDLQLQPLRQGGISFLSGLVAIDTSGNLSVSGNAMFAQNVDVKGNLAAKTISPLANQDLNIQLANASGSAASLPSLNVSNASGSSVFSLNQSGDVLASGSANFAQLIAKGLNIVRGVQADTSITETIASGSAGTAVIYKGQRERTIISPFVKATSLIYITPTSDTKGQTPYVARLTDPTQDDSSQSSFTVQIPAQANTDIHMNWWIVN